MTTSPHPMYATPNHDAQDRLLAYGSARYGWSRNGERVSRTAGGVTTTYYFELEGALASVASPGARIEYVNDPLGRRVGRKVNGSLERGWLWLDQQVVAEWDPRTAGTKRFVYSEDALAPVLMLVGTNSYYLVSDERGSVRRVVDTADGSVVQALEYDEFGRVLTDTSPGFQPFGFTGGLHDPETGWVRMGRRDYDPETGQWTTRDPVGFAGGQFSLYAYVGNDPLNYVDPSGTGPFLGFLNRNRQRAIDAAFDNSPGNGERFAGALDRYDRSVQAAVITGQVAVNTGALINSLAPGPKGPRLGVGRGATASAAGRAQAARAAASEAAATTKTFTSTTTSSATTTTVISVGGRGAADLAMSNPWARTAANAAAAANRIQPSNFQFSLPDFFGWL